MKMPGKNPARKTPTGNLLHEAPLWSAGELMFEAEVAVTVLDVPVVVADVVRELVEEALVEVSEDEDEVSVVPTMLVPLIMLQTDDAVELGRQAYPNGQHLFPH